MTLRRLFPSSSIASKNLSIGASKRSFALAVRFHETGDATKVYKYKYHFPSFFNICD
jgi:hypothetical protein